VVVLTWVWRDQLRGRFGARVPSAECKAGKPSPEPYLEGLRRLGLDAGMCIAFEDSPAGLACAHSLPSRSTSRLALSAA
jgi:HAD superfamily hydrolase (TIGR01509 family)